MTGIAAPMRRNHVDVQVALLQFEAVCINNTKEYPRERSRSTLLSSPDGSRSAASATAVVASARVLASSLSTRTSAAVVSEARSSAGRLRLSMDLPCDLQVVSAWDVPGNSASSSQIEGEGEFLGLWECCDNVEMTRDETIIHWVRQRFEDRGLVSMSVSSAFSWRIWQPRARASSVIYGQSLAMTCDGGDIRTSQSTQIQSMLHFPYRVRLEQCKWGFLGLSTKHELETGQKS